MIRMLESANILPVLVKVAHHFLSFDTVVILISWATALAGAALTFAIRTDHSYRKTFRNFVRYCFPAAIIRSPSCRLDAIFTITGHWIHRFAVAPVLLSSVFVTKFTYDALSAYFGPQPQHAEAVWQQVLILGCSVLLADLLNFVTHYVEHKSKLMWEFHKVHHAATFLIPITNRRIHPIQEIFDDTVTVLGVGMWIGATSYVFRLTIGDNMVVGMDAYFFANLLSFYHLRHSHVPMSYGRLEHVFLSPAQHHLHHSYETKHWDRNFGLLLSCWDKMAGTFMLSEPPDRFRVGLPQEYASQYDRFFKLYATPFVNASRMLSGALRRSRVI